MDAVATPVDDNVNVSAPSASALPEAVIEPDIPVEESSAVYDPSNPPMVNAEFIDSLRANEIDQANQQQRQHDEQSSPVVEHAPVIAMLPPNRSSISNSPIVTPLPPTPEEEHRRQQQKRGACILLVTGVALAIIIGILGSNLGRDSSDDFDDDWANRGGGYYSNDDYWNQQSTEPIQIEASFGSACWSINRVSSWRRRFLQAALGPAPLGQQDVVQLTNTWSSQDNLVNYPCATWTLDPEKSHIILHQHLGGGWEDQYGNKEEGAYEEIGCLSYRPDFKSTEDNKPYPLTIEACTSSDINQKWNIDLAGQISPQTNPDLCISYRVQDLQKPTSDLFVSDCFGDGLGNSTLFSTGGYTLGDLSSHPGTDQLTVDIFYSGAGTLNPQASCIYLEVPSNFQSLVLGPDCLQVSEWDYVYLEYHHAGLFRHSVSTATTQNEFCLTANFANEAPHTVYLDVCDVDNWSQLWYLDADNRLRTIASQTYCLEVVEKDVDEASNSTINDLQVTECDETATNNIFFTDPGDISRLP